MWLLSVTQLGLNEGDIYDEGEDWCQSRKKLETLVTIEVDNIH